MGIHHTAVRALVAIAVAGGLSACGFKIEPDPDFVAGSPAAAADRERPAREVAIDRLVEMVSSESPQVRANAVEGLSRAGARSESVVALALRDENPGVRSVAALVCGRAKLRALAPTLRDLLNDESAFVRDSAIGALREMGEKVDPTPLASDLLESSDPRLRAHAAFILGEMGERSAVPMLQQAWADPMRSTNETQRRLTRLQIAEALIKLGDDTSIDAVRAALYPSRPEELEATALAVQIIGEVRDRGSIDQLIYLSEQRGPQQMPAEVRLAVAGSLAKLGLTQGGFIADEYASNADPLIRAQAATVYGRTGHTGHLPRLGVMLDDPSEVVRVAAASGIVDLMSGGAQADARGD